MLRMCYFFHRRCIFFELNTNNLYMAVFFWECIGLNVGLLMICRSQAGVD